MDNKTSVYAMILAGGGGTRLWPLSRQHRPKHLLPVCGNDSMLAQTWARLEPLVPSERLLVVTVAAHAQAVCREIKTILPQNVVIEPMGRGTAACVGLTALLIRRSHPDAVMMVLPADHTIADGEGFRSVLRAAVSAAEDGHLVTLGIVPSGPETGYGYIQRSTHLRQAAGHDVFRVERFAEKPDLATATAFLQTGQYYWNSGIFIWKVSIILDEIKRHLPELYSQLMQIEPALGTPQQEQVMAQVWQHVRGISIDVGIMERAHDVVMIPADVGWSDVGCWTSLADLQASDEQGNVLQGQHVALDCQDTFVSSSNGRLVAVIGLRGMVIVDTGDAVLVCPKERVQDVKKVVEQLQREGKDQYL